MEGHHAHLLNDIGVAVLAATGLGLVARWTRQPIILGYLIAGALLGNKLGFKVIRDPASVEVISEIGLILLLFIIGLEMNVQSLLSSGKQLLVAGFGQFPLCVLLGLGLFVGLMGYGMTGGRSDGLYLALMCGLSSTAVVVKLLYDKQELDTLPGQMTVGILVVQDLFAIFVLAFQPNFASPAVLPVLKAIGGAILLLGGAYVVAMFVLKRILQTIDKSPEMVVAVSLAWCALMAGAGSMLGVSKEMGALAAGLSVAACPFNVHVAAKTLPLRDFFLTLFFVSLGMQIKPLEGSMIWLIIAIVALTIASRFLTIYPLLAICGSGRRTAFITSLNLAQISEFSLVIGALGLGTYGHIADNTQAAVIYAMAITAVLSSYTIRYNHQLYLLFDKLMVKLGRGESAIAPALAPAVAAGRPVLLLGIGRTARQLLDELEKNDPHLLWRVRILDFNTETLRSMGARGVAGMFGDLSSRDSLEHAHLKQCDLIISTVPDVLLKGTSNATIARTCRSLAPGATIAVVADDLAHERRLRSDGADHVINLHGLAAESLADLIRDRIAPRKEEPQTPAPAEQAKAVVAEPNG